MAGVFDRAAPTYDRVGVAYHEHFARRLVELAGLPAGADLLDVGCGHGAVLLAAARQAGGLTGVDVSAGMLDRARDALGAAGVDDVRLEVMDAEDLAFASGSFDAVTAAFLLFFLPDPEGAVAEFHRVLRPGGRIAVSTWGDEDPRWAWADELLADLQVDRRALQRPFDSPGRGRGPARRGRVHRPDDPEGGARDPLRRRRPVVGLAVVVQLSGRAGAARPGGGGLDPLRGDDPPRSGASGGRSPDVAGRVGGLRPPAGHVKRTRGQVVHVQTLADLDARLAAGASSLRGWRVHRLDLTERGEALTQRRLGGATFLGCTFAPGDAARVEDAGGLVLPDDRRPAGRRLPVAPLHPGRAVRRSRLPPLARRAGLRLVAATPRPGGHPRAGSARPLRSTMRSPSGSVAGDSWG